MSLDNEIIDTTTKTDTSKKKKKSRKPASSSKDKATSFSLGEKFKQKKTKNTIGIVFVLLALYGFFACISYFFTWQQDQDQVMHQSFFNYLFSGDSVVVANWLGKFGAWTSHLLMFRWFGFTSLIIPFLFFLFGFKILTKISLFPLKKTLQVCLSAMVWGSLFLGAFEKFPNYLGGSFGFYLNEWISLSVGKFGMVLFLLVSLYVLVLLIFNPNFSALLEYLPMFKKQNEEEEEQIITSQSVDDFITINPIKEEEIEKDQPSEPISFDEDEEEPEVVKPVSAGKTPLAEKENSDDFEIEIGDDPKPEVKKEETVEEVKEEMDVEDS